MFAAVFRIVISCPGRRIAAHSKGRIGRGAAKGGAAVAHSDGMEKETPRGGGAVTASRPRKARGATCCIVLRSRQACLSGRTPWEFPVAQVVPAFTRGTRRGEAGTRSLGKSDHRLPLEV